MSRRRSTIHDAAALRLHPNGVRVNDVVQTTLRSKAIVTTKTPLHARKVSNGNWIATDAGGDGRVAKRRKISKRQSQDAIEEEPVVEGLGEGDTAEALEQDEDVPDRMYKDARAKQRVAFENDYTFLAAPTSVPAESLQPSSDFLKCIHHFASLYYDARGQLFDSAGQYRKVKKENRLRLRQALAASGSQLPNTSQNEGGHEEEEEHTESDGSAQEASKRAERRPKGKGKAKSKASRQIQRDMYKAFDGSALLCIGMLLQSHITSSLANNVPDSWGGDESDTRDEASME